MSNMFANMDNNTIKTMMQAQGMSISDEQINMMKNPHLIKQTHKQMKQNPQMFDQINSMKNSTTHPVNHSSNTFTNSTTQVSSHNNQETQQQTPPKFPDMSQFPKNMDMKSMMEFVSKNPDILKMISPEMAKMFGGNSKDGSVPPQLETIMWILGMPHRIKSFFTSPKGLLITGLVVYLIYNYFWG